MRGPLTVTKSFPFRFVISKFSISPFCFTPITVTRVRMAPKPFSGLEEISPPTGTGFSLTLFWSCFIRTGT